MHLLIPFASTLADETNAQPVDVPLPQLARLLARLGRVETDTADAATLNPPHERAEAAALGWHGGDGRLPFAARAAEADGIAIRDLAWGRITPCHWVVGRNRVTLADPAALALDEAESRAAFAALHGLLDGDGWRFAWGAPQRWYLAHESLDGLPCASLDRVIGRDVEQWLQGGAAREAAATEAARHIRRLQSEVQMALYPQPLNEAREARGLPTLNSFWLDGCGRRQADRAGAAPVVDDRLRAPLLAGDRAGWLAAWQALDAEALGPLAEAAQRGEAVTLTLCGERNAQRYENVGRSLWQRLGSRFHVPTPQAVLAAL